MSEAFRRLCRVKRIFVKVFKLTFWVLQGLMGQRNFVTLVFIKAFIKVGFEGAARWLLTHNGFLRHIQNHPVLRFVLGSLISETCAGCF